MEELSFSGQVKDELAHLFPGNECCRRMELAALIRASGRIEIGSGQRVSCVIVTDHAAVARKVLRLIKTGFGLQTLTMVMRRRRLRKNLSYMVRVPSQTGLVELLRAVGVLDADGHLLDWAEPDELKSDHCRRAFLRGTFLGTGWVSSPDKQHHLEMTTTATEAADAVGQMLFAYGIPARMAWRKESLVLYIKDGTGIARFLSVVGAHQSLLHYEDVRAMKEMKNLVNRQVNAETANLNKTIEAAARQLEALERLRASGGMERLTGPLRELAELRLKHPEANLTELGEMCHPKVSKSAVNHRMRQLMRMAESE